MPTEPEPRSCELARIHRCPFLDLFGTFIANPNSRSIRKEFPLIGQLGTAKRVNGDSIKEYKQPRSILTVIFLEPIPQSANGWVLEEQTAPNCDPEVLPELL